MCKSRAQGGRRCFPHAQEAYKAAVAGLRSANSSMDHASRYVSRNPDWRAKQREEQAIRSHATKQLRTATNAYKKAAGEFAANEQGRAELEARRDKAQAAGQARVVARYERELALGDQVIKTQQARKAAAESNEEFLKQKGAQLVSVKHQGEEIGYVAVGPDRSGASQGVKASWESRDVAHDGRTVGTLERWETTTNLASPGSVIRVDGATKNQWRFEPAGARTGGAYTPQRETRNQALGDALRHATRSTTSPDP